MSDATFAISLYLEALHSEYPVVAPIHMAPTGMLCVSVSFAQGRTMGPSSGYRIRQFSFHPHNGGSHNTFCRLHKGGSMSQAAKCMQRDTPESRTYTVEDIASMLNIGRTSAYNLVKEGHFKTVRIGNAIRISKKSFDEWLDTLVI